MILFFSLSFLWRVFSNAFDLEVISGLSSIQAAFGEN